MSAAIPSELPRPFGPYELVRRLAVGGVAEVFLARARSVAGFEKAVALKMIHPTLCDDPEFTQGLIEEANITSQLSHKNIVQVIDLGQLDGLHYIAMEYVDGIDLGRLLARLLKQNLRLSPRVSAYVLREICEGLDHAHRKVGADGRPLRIVHRDISPGNILLSFSGEVKLSDFGLARASLRAATTQAGVIKGKYNYMSPEQARGTAIDPRADVFAAGLVLYEMVTGQCAYPNAPLPLLLTRVNGALIEPAEKISPELPKALAEVIKRATAADPKHRHPSARALGDDLAKFLYSLPPGADLELSRILEETAVDERGASQPLGAMLVDDSSDDVTQIESSAQIRAKFMVPKPARPKGVKAPVTPEPAHTTEVSPKASELFVEWDAPTVESPHYNPPENLVPSVRPVSSATPRAMAPEPRSERPAVVRALTLPPTGLRWDQGVSAEPPRPQGTPPGVHRFSDESGESSPVLVERASTPATVSVRESAQPPEPRVTTSPTLAATRSRSQRRQLIAAASLAALSLLALAVVILTSGR